MTETEWNDWHWTKMLKGLHFILQSMGSQWQFWNKGRDNDKGVVKN